MSLVTMDAYKELIEERPRKFAPEEVRYREAQGAERCDQCMHYFRRALDGIAVCEIMRPVPEEHVLPEWTCDFQTPDGDTFPLYQDQLELQEGG